MPLDNLADLTVPAQNSAANITIRDIIGNKTDNNLGTSLYARVDELYDHWQAERRVYPTLAVGATIISANADWTYGAYGTVVPANTITSNFHIFNISVEACNRDATFQLEFYKGAADDVISAIRFNITGGFFGNQVYFLGSEEIDANAQVRARIASSNGTAQIATVQVSIVYIEH